MTILDRISLTWHYGKGIFLIGAVFNLVCTGFQAGGFSYTFMVDSFIIKAVLTAITVYLTTQFSDRDAIFFYSTWGYRGGNCLSALSWPISLPLPSS